MTTSGRSRSMRRHNREVNRKRFLKNILNCWRNVTDEWAEEFAKKNHDNPSVCSCDCCTCQGKSRQERKQDEAEEIERRRNEAL